MLTEVNEYVRHTLWVEAKRFIYKNNEIVRTSYYKL
jgi:hypothetical protein